MVAQVHEKFLTDHGATLTRHSGRCLYEHLKSTHDLLRDWGNPEPVCLAGLFHSAYGTVSFKHKSVDLKERPTVRALIGKDAEYLVYLFCVIDRPKVFLAAQAMFQRHLFDRHTHSIVSVTHQIRNQLVEIEAANLLEQGASADTLGGLLRLGLSDMARLAVAGAQLKLEEPQ